ncbi:MAG: FAD-linked oxidase C-terminal domain-containing protein [Planctomycetota bacterium]
MTALGVLTDKRPAPEAREGLDRAAVRDLVNAVRGDVRLGLHDRLLYATDASIYQVEPLAVLIPEDLDDVAAAMSCCARHGMPVLPRGGGTSLAGQCVNRAVVIDLSAKCRGLSGYDAGARIVRAEAGATIGQINELVARDGLQFPPDPSTYRQATVGGCIGNNAAGSHSVLYGRTVESLRGVEVLCANGQRIVYCGESGGVDELSRHQARLVASVVSRHASQIRERFPKTRRRNAGYALDMVLAQLDAGARPEDLDLTPLFAGAEGTLGLVTAATLKLEPLPAHKGLAVAAFASVQHAIDAVVPILETQPAAIELLDDLVISLARQNNEQRAYTELLPRPGGVDASAVLYVEYFGTESDAISRQLERLAQLLPSAAIETHTDEAAMANAWKLRVAGEPLLHAVPGNRKPLGFIEDNAIPPERLGDFVRELREIVESEGTHAAYYAHASVGVLHVRPLLDLRDPADTERMQRIARRTADLARSLGGVMSGEHGDGRARGPLLRDFYGPELMSAFAEIRAIFDPDGRMNPGNITEPGPLESVSLETRVSSADGPAVALGRIDTFYTFEDQHGLRGAVEMCNGAGVCRKTSAGTMCPSYMGTLDERHSTRGRGNALRLAVTGQFDALGTGDPTWDDPETIATLDLCLSCKACKSECPSNVDIARLKAEYTAQRYATGVPVPLRARVFSNVRLLNSLGSMAPSATNLANKIPPIRALLGRLLGLAPKRSLPVFARPLYAQWGPPDAHAGRRVAFFGDCFTMFNEPEIGLAAKRVLEASGYEVDLPMRGLHGCCQRPAISNGLLSQAVREIDRLLSQLEPVIEDERVEAILFAEPSCLSAVIDDWLSLKLKTPIETRKKLASKAMLVEAFIEREWDRHPKRPEFNPEGTGAVFHGHCHQKATVGTAEAVAALRRCGGLDVLDAGCCGMAGAFGFERDKFDLSMRIGERVLLPAVRNAGERVVLAPGASCRHQILDGTGVRALHPVEHLASRLATSD